MTSYYLSIEHPAEMRKELLNSAKDSVQLLKAQYSLREIRERKLDLLSEFADTVDEIAEMFDQLHEGLPSHEGEDIPSVVSSIRDAMKKEAAEQDRLERLERASMTREEERVSRKNPAPPPPPAPSKSPSPSDSSEQRAESALEKLEKKLSSIESKLNKL